MRNYAVHPVDFSREETDKIFDGREEGAAGGRMTATTAGLGSHRPQYLFHLGGAEPAWDSSSSSDPPPPPPRPGIAAAGAPPGLRSSAGGGGLAVSTGAAGWSCSIRRSGSWSVGTPSIIGKLGGWIDAGVSVREGWIWLEFVPGRSSELAAAPEVVVKSLFDLVCG